jgi:hypothetical protein
MAQVKIAINKQAWVFIAAAISMLKLTYAYFASVIFISGLIIDYQKANIFCEKSMLFGLDTQNKFTILLGSALLIVGLISCILSLVVFYILLATENTINLRIFFVLIYSIGTISIFCRGNKK